MRDAVEETLHYRKHTEHTKYFITKVTDDQMNTVNPKCGMMILSYPKRKPALSDADIYGLLMLCLDLQTYPYQIQIAD
uniref:Phage protein n=1 Tax=Heterorhabditis bacteriophora TaxID=37862 RepID=A0A1I7XGJ6_HETBA